MREDNHLLEWSRVSEFVVLDSFNSTWTLAWLLFPSVEFQRFPEGRKKNVTAAMETRAAPGKAMNTSTWPSFLFDKELPRKMKSDLVRLFCGMKQTNSFGFELMWILDSWSVINRTKVPLVRSTGLFAKLWNNEESPSSLGLLDDGSLAPLWAIFVIICVGREGQQPHSWATTSAMDFSEQ